MSTTRKRILLGFALLLAAVGLVLLGQAGLISPVQDLALRGTSGVQRALSTAFFNIRDLFTAPRNVQELIQENSRLSQRIAQLEAEIVTLREQASEVERLQALLNAAKQAPENRYLAAN